jgi:hypothetical protein
MVQEIIVYIIIVFVLIYTIYKLVKSVRTKPTSACEGCTGCGIKQEMMKNGKTTTHDCSYEPIKKT